MKKERIYLTDITLHVRGYRQTGNFSKAAQKGRMYSPMPKDYVKNIDTKTNSMKISIDLPPDLKDRISKGEVELMIPDDGLFVYAGKDLLEFMDKMNQKERKQLIHKNRTWHSKGKGV